MNRQYMEDFRRTHEIDMATMARTCRCSQTLIDMLESWDGEVTHPRIALRIARAYHLNQKQYESLLPVNYRPASAEYDPDRYKIDVKFRKFLTTRCL